jgi:hypothetical protein
MIHQVKDPITVLNRMLESLLISYRYDALEAVLVMVLDYYRGRAPGADRAFLRLRFEDVLNFTRIPGLFADLQRFTDTYSIRDSRPHIVLQKVDVDEHARPMTVALGFGHSFGGVSFTCTGVAAQSRNTRAIGRGGDQWDYFDFENADPIDFHEPFA